MDTLAARQQMVDQQIRTWEVLDPRVLDALSAVPREAFVPDGYRELAFADAPLPIGFGQSMLAPKIQGRILQALGVDPSGPRARDRHRHRLSERLLEPARRLDAFDRHSPRSHGARGRQPARRAAGARAARDARRLRLRAPWASTTSLRVTGSMPVYDRALRARAARSAAGCSPSSARRPSWTRCWCAGSTRPNGFARACSRRSSIR